MRQINIPDSILLQVEKPARYIGNEIGAVYKDPEKIPVRVAFCYPDVYEVGMSHLGCNSYMQVLTVGKCLL